MKLAIGATRSCHNPTPRHSAIVGSASLGTSSRRPTTVRIGKRWMEYQGANGWDGLLDPLDDALRAEIVRYGEFVRAAYDCFGFDPSSPSYATCRFSKRSLLRRSGLPGSGYRVTRNLTATSGIDLPQWVDVCPAWLSRRSSWIGYVAVCEDEEEMRRLGRRDVVVAYRGTATCLEWLENLRATLTPLPGGQREPMVECGFWSLFTSLCKAHRSLRDQVRREVRRLLHTYRNDPRPMSLTVTGHSLGAALAVLTADDITSAFEDAPMVTVVSFGGPRVGNASFRHRLEKNGCKVLRIVNTRDIVTKIPGFLADNGSGDKPQVRGPIPSSLLSRTGWVYADIGQELRVSSPRMANVAACHDLNHYLDLVNELSGSCPLRSLTMQAMAGRR